MLEHIVEVYGNFYVAELFHSQLWDFSFHTVWMIYWSLFWYCEHICVHYQTFFWCCFKNLWSGVRRKWLFGKHITVFIQRNANQTIRSVKHNLLIILVIFWRLKALSWENFEICLFVLLILINRCDELLFFQCSLHYFVIREMCKIF